MKAIRVPKEKAEEVRKVAERSSAKDKRRLVVCRGDYVEIPIYDGFEHLFSYEIVEQENPVFAKSKDLFGILKKRIPENLHNLIPRRYKIIGDLILVKIAEELENYKSLIGETLLEIHPHCKAVWRDMGKKGMLRRPEVELIAGEGSETVHRENGCLFKLDVTKVMFSPGNLAERMRMAKLGKGEVVIDMFAGIGYFSIPMCVHSRPEKVYSIEINPDSYKFLLENIKLNHVDRIVPILGDSMFVIPENIEVDRVIMGHIRCHEFIPAAIRALREGIIHYHESVPEAVINRPVERIKRAARDEGREVKILNFRKVKNYSPGVIHVVVDARIC